MITEDYVSFETAKLLKEKGFDEYTLAYYDETGIFEYDPDFLPNGLLCPTFCSAPTLGKTMKWLEAEHGIFITVRRGIGGNGFVYTPYIFDKDSNEHKQHTGYDSRAEAEEAAIRYCVEKLI